MYSKAEAAQLKKDFWTALGQYMKPVRNSEGENIHWVNYKTGIKGIYFRWQANRTSVSAAIEIVHKEENERISLYQKMEALKPVFKEVVGEWSWLSEVYDEHGLPTSKIYITQESVNLFDKSDWPVMISFLKEKMMKLDAFWAQAKMYFET